MNRSQSLVYAFVAVGVILLVAPALFPVQQILVHETRPGTIANETQLEQAGYEVVAYENLSDRGQELYVSALKNGGSYSIEVDQGASDFEYASGNGDRRPRGARSADEERGRPTIPGGIVIERPPDADLPPPQEPARGDVPGQSRPDSDTAERGSDRTTNETANGSAVEAQLQERRQERREQIMRYDLMQTRTGVPSPADSANLFRLLSVVAGVIALGSGGYVASRP